MKGIETDECNSSWKLFGRANGQWLCCAVCPALRCSCPHRFLEMFLLAQPSSVACTGWRIKNWPASFFEMKLHHSGIFQSAPSLSTPRTCGARNNNFTTVLDYFCSGEPVPTSADGGIKSDLPSASSWRRSPTLLLIGRSCVSVCPTQKPLPEFCTCRTETEVSPTHDAGQLGDKQKRTSLLCLVNPERSVDVQVGVRRGWVGGPTAANG